MEYRVRKDHRRADDHCGVAHLDLAKRVHPDSKPLRWQLGIDDNIIDASIRQREFINWLDKLVLPTAGLPPRAS